VEGTVIVVIALVVVGFSLRDLFAGFSLGDLSVGFVLEDLFLFTLLPKRGGGRGGGEGDQLTIS